jgi:hypothetical protein
MPASLCLSCSAAFGCHVWVAPFEESTGLENMSGVGWSHVIAGWAIVLLLVGLVVSGTSLAPALGLSGGGSEWHRITIPQYDPSSVGRSNYGPEEMDADPEPPRQ